MREAVVLKSYQNGITIRMNPDCTFEEILESVSSKFARSRNFFGNARLAVSLEGKELTPQEELTLLDTINDCSDIQVVCIVGRDEDKNKLFVKALHQMDRKIAGSEDGQFYKGSLTKHERLETEASIIILGNVEAGCSVISSRDIIIIGALRGTAYAGGDGSADHYIAALEMTPESLSIGGSQYQPKHRSRRWKLPGKSDLQPQIAYVRQQKIVLEPLTDRMLSIL